MVRKREKKEKERKKEPKKERKEKEKRKETVKEKHGCYECKALVEYDTDSVELLNFTQTGLCPQCFNAVLEMSAVPVKDNFDMAIERLLKAIENIADDINHINSSIKQLNLKP